MELNLSTNFSTLTTTKPETITKVLYINRLFLNTVACQAIAGAFTFAAILNTGYHVNLFFCFSSFIKFLI
jgi:hypothetical protein